MSQAVNQPVGVLHNKGKLSGGLVYYTVADGCLEGLSGHVIVQGNLMWTWCVGIESILGITMTYLSMSM